MPEHSTKPKTVCKTVDGIHSFTSNKDEQSKGNKLIQTNIFSLFRRKKNWDKRKKEQEKEKKKQHNNSECYVSAYSKNNNECYVSAYSKNNNSKCCVSAYSKNNNNECYVSAYSKNSACTRATLRNSSARVRGHCILDQLIGTSVAPATTHKQTVVMQKSSLAAIYIYGVKKGTQT